MVCQADSDRHRVRPLYRLSHVHTDLNPSSRTFLGSRGPSVSDPGGCTHHLHRASGALCPSPGWLYSESSLQVVMTIAELFLDRDQKKKWGGHLLKPGHVMLRTPVALMSLRMTSYKNHGFCPPLASGSKTLSRNHHTDHSHNYRVIIINRSLQSQALWHNPVAVGLMIVTIGDISVLEGGQVLSGSLTASACHLPSS